MGSTSGATIGSLMTINDDPVSRKMCLVHLRNGSRCLAPGKMIDGKPVCADHWPAVVSAGFRFPKPVKREKKPKRMRRRRARRISGVGSDPGYLARVAKLPCPGPRLFPGHVCVLPVQVDHDRNPRGRLTGTGRKEPDDTGTPKCVLLHQQWTDHAGPFRGWTWEQRRDFADQQIAETRAALGYVPRSG